MEVAGLIPANRFFFALFDLDISVRGCMRRPDGEKEVTLVILRRGTVPKHNCNYPLQINGSSRLSD